MWSIATGQRLAARGWDDEFVVYNNLSGDTHLIDPDSMAVLDFLRAGPATMEAVLAFFSTGLAPDDLAALPETMAALLTQLQRLFLVQAAAAPC